MSHGIYSYPLRLAAMYKTPLVFWGELQSEISSYHDYLNDEIEYEDEKKFNMIRTWYHELLHMHGMIDTPDNKIDVRDLYPYTYPSLEELKELKYCSLPLGSFIPWDYKKNTDLIIKELGWEVDEMESAPQELNPHGEKTECFMQGTRDYIKYLKRGYSRVSQINAFDVRSGILTPDEADKLNTEYDGLKPESLKIFLEYVGLEEKEFNEIISSSVIFPNKPNFDNKCGAKMWDFDKWYRENNKK